MKMAGLGRGFWCANAWRWDDIRGLAEGGRRPFLGPWEETEALAKGGRGPGGVKRRGHFPPAELGSGYGARCAPEARHL